MKVTKAKGLYCEEVVELRQGRCRAVLSGRWRPEYDGGIACLPQRDGRPWFAVCLDRLACRGSLLPPL